MLAFRSKLIQRIKGALCSFGEEIQTQNLNIYNINETVIQNLSILFYNMNKQAVVSGK